MQKLRLFGMNGFFALMLAFTAGLARGQQAGYLILVDAANKQPFTVRIGETLMSSSSHGHLLFPQLKDSSYRIFIQFPKNRVPEQGFLVNMNKKDQGFQLQGSDSSWVLYNWQSGETLHPLKELDSSRLLDQGIRREDGFSRLMASVVNDSSVMYDTYAGRAFSGDTGVAKVVQADSPALSRIKKPSILRTDTAKTVKTTKKRALDSLATKPPTAPGLAKSGVKKLREVSLKVSRKIIFLDEGAEGSRDTITLFVYFENPEPAGKKPKEDPMVTARRLLKDSTGSKPLAVNNKPAAMPKEPAIPKDTVKAVADCQQQANDADVESLRSAILVRNAEQEKISVATGAFAMKCFSVTQVRLLADLFVSDRAKYKFLTAAHGHISDPEHFRELADMLMDKAYLKKFIVLAEKRR
jgi:hypothetical protein